MFLEGETLKVVGRALRLSNSRRANLIVSQVWQSRMGTVQGFSLVHFTSVAALQPTALRRRGVEPSPFGQSFCSFITVYKLTEVPTVPLAPLRHATNGH